MSDSGKTYPRHANELPNDALKALAHPLRVRILDELSMYGPFTASGLGERLGESSGATSYHLRQLEKHGLVVEDTERGNARERWWMRRPGPIAIRGGSDFPAGSAERLAAQLVVNEFNLGRDQAFREFLASGDELFDEEWRQVAVSDTVNLRLTAEQLKALVTDLDEVFWRHIDRYKATPSAGARPVQLQLNAFPLVRGEGVSDVSGEEKNS